MMLVISSEALTTTLQDRLAMSLDELIPSDSQDFETEWHR